MAQKKLLMPADDSVGTAIHDFDGHQTYREKRGRHFALNATYDDVKPENSRVLEIVRHFAAADVLQGKSCSCYPAVAPDVTRAGGTFVDLQMTEAHTCGKLVTAPAWPAHPAWLAQFLHVLGTRVEL